MDLEEFVSWADVTPLTEVEAEAVYRRQKSEEDRREAAESMELSPSELAELHESARQKITRASNLLVVLESLEIEAESSIGRCDDCGEPKFELLSHPTSGKPDALCEECEQLAEFVR